jgi:GcrA cell cycle regulator
MARDSYDWTPRAIELLGKLWAEGLTTAEIGARLGVGKNAVIGKAHRLKLASRASPIKASKPSNHVLAPRASFPRAVSPESRRTIKAMFVDKKTTEKTTTRKMTAREAPANVPTDPSKRCCFPLWDDNEKGAKDYCGRPTQASKNYCPEHYLVCFVPTRSRSATAATV